ncbi:hypothetical protein E2C01_060561 [Portunus trituberculatus]|uniref:Uncharacterized protein n=1 Tax=Portunus trituberculatus TaxID=210409 RepID=A0A5B7HCF9_PORTR|nr:hypothetical protein [Portunus trituberculatus]
MLFVQQRRINWLQWPSGVRWVAEKEGPFVYSHMDGRSSNRAGFDEVDDDDVQDLLESHAGPLSNDELIEQDKASQETEKEGDEEEPVRGLDIKTLRECLSSIEKVLETLTQILPGVPKWLMM